MSSDQEVCEEPDLGVETEEIICETVFIKSEEDELEDEEDDTPSETYSVEGQRPVRPVERQKMRPWLIDLLDKNILPGLSWQNKRENIFRISWKHAAHNCFNRNRDSDLFERWAFHTGRHHEGNHKRWKANFRCALNSLPDVMELKELGVRKGDNAFKVYKFLDSPEPTMKEKMEIKRKYSLMAGIKLDESHSGSSTPTVSTAPSSPEREGSSGVDGGIQTLLKAIELKTQQQTDMSKTPQKRGSSGGTTQTRSKRAKKDSRDDVPVETEATVVICSGRPSPASTPGSDTISGVQKMPYITAIDPMSGIPYVTAVDQKTGKLTLVQLRKTDSPSAPTTPTGRSEIIIPSSKMLMGLPGQGQSMMAVPQAQTITSTIKCGEHFITVPMSVAASLQKETTTEEKVTIPMQLLQQELQKQAQQQVQQAQQGVPNLINLGNLFASNPAAALHLAKQMSASTGSIPIPVLEQISQAQQKMTEKSVPKTVIQTEVQQVRMVAPPLVSESLPPVPQLNKNITSIAAALRMSIPSSQPSSPSVVTGISSPIQQSQPVSTTTLGPGLAQDPQGIRSKLVSRLMVSGSSMTNQSPGVRMPVSSLIPAPTSTPRPRLDHILVKPNPNLTLPSTHLQPVRTSDMVVMSTASSSSLDFVTGPPKLMTAISERTIDLNANKSTLAIPSTSTHLKNSREADVVSIGSSPSPVCTPELRPDILDRQLTIELSKMEKEPSAQRMTEESQHLSQLSDNYSRRTVQTQCNMFLWNYLNGKMEEAGKSDLFQVLGPMPPSKKSVWTQCAFVQNAALEYSPSMNTGHCELQSGEENRKKKIILEAIGILKSPQYKVLAWKVVTTEKKRKCLVIRNRQYFGVMGHDLDPLTLTLTMKGKMTLNIVFKPVEEFSIINVEKDGINRDPFIEILDKITNYSFCPGIEKRNMRSCRRRSDIIFFNYPFKHCQSDSCQVWYGVKDEAAGATKTHLNLCSHCKDINHKLNGDHMEKRQKVQTNTSKVNSVSGVGSAAKENRNSLVGRQIVLKEVISSKPVIIKEMEKVVVEKIARVDTVLECVPDMPP